MAAGFERGCVHVTGPDPVTKNLNIKGKTSCLQTRLAPTHFFLGTGLQFFFLLFTLLLHVLIISSIIKFLSAAEILSSGSRTKSVSISRRGS